MRYCLFSLLLISGCSQMQGEPAMNYVIPPRPDDVRLSVANLRYDATTSGYTFSYDEKKPDDPCTPNRWVYLRKDLLVGTRELKLPCAGEGTDFTVIQLRADWDGPRKPITREELESVPSLPARRPGEDKMSP